MNANMQSALLYIPQSMQFLQSINFPIYRSTKLGVVDEKNLVHKNEIRSCLLQLILKNR